MLTRSAGYLYRGEIGNVIWLSLNAIFAAFTVLILLVAPASGFSLRTLIMALISQGLVAAIGLLAALRWKFAVGNEHEATSARVRALVLYLLWGGFVGGLFFFFYMSSWLIGLYMPLDMYGQLMRGSLAHDTGFHVVLIQSIMDTGIPSLHLHGSPLVGYHLGTHYFDAALFTLLNLDPFEFYGPAQLAKVGPALAALAFVCLWVTQGRAWWQFALVFFLSCGVLLNTWHVVLSHGLWLPVVTSLLAWPWVCSLIYEPLRLRTGLIYVVFCAFLLFGKASHGLAFATVVGMVLFLQSYRNWRIYVIGGVMLFVLLVYSAWASQSGDRSGGGQLMLGELSYQAHTGVLATAGLIYAMARPEARRHWTLFAACLVVLALFSLFLPLIVTTDVGDLGYFGMALLFITWIMFINVWFHRGRAWAWAWPRTEGWPVKSAWTIGWFCLALVVQNAAGKVGKLDNFSERIPHLNAYLTGHQRANVKQGSIDAIRDYRQANTKGYGSSERLFLSKSQWVALSRSFVKEGRSDWHGAILAQAILRTRFIYGVPKDTTSYGFAGYDAPTHWVEEAPGSHAVCPASGSEDFTLTQALSCATHKMDT